MPFDEIDFEKRDFVQHSGWPIAYEDLEPYYRRAHEYCECGEYEYSVAHALPDAGADLIEGFRDQEITTDIVERWSPPTRFGKRYRQLLKKAENIRSAMAVFMP